MVGFAATSNVEAGRRYGLAVAGTMAHSYIESFPTEKDAFVAFATDFPTRTTFLVDTYDTPNGVRTAIEVIRELGLSDHLGIRLDSGDLDALAAAVTGDLGRGRSAARADLRERRPRRARRATGSCGAARRSTRSASARAIGVSADAPYVDSVYKLVEYDGRPVLKLSAAKATAPGSQAGVPGLGGDVIALRNEPVPDGARAAPACR